MKGTYLLTDWLKYMLRGWIKLLVIVLVCCLIFGFTPSIRGTVTSEPDQHADRTITASSILTFSNHETYFNKDGVKTNVNYATIWDKASVMLNLVPVLEDNYDMSKFEPKWKTMTDSAKNDWINAHFKTTVITYTDSYEISFTISSKPDHYDYVLAQTPNIYKDYIQCIGKAAATYTSSKDYTQNDYALQQSDYALTLPYSNITETRLTVKYAAIGFIFGVLIYLLYQSFLFIFSRRVTSAASYRELEGVVCDSGTPDAVTRFAERLILSPGRNNIVAVSSSIGSSTLYEALCGCLAENEYRVAAVDLTDKITINRENVENIEGTAKSKLRLIGKFKDYIAPICEHFDYVVIHIPAPNIDGSDKQYFAASGGILLTEAQYVTNRKYLEKILEASKGNAVSIVWTDKGSVKGA